MRKILFQESSNKNHNININQKEVYSKKRETFRKLKLAYSKQGDLINEQKFHALEMIAHDNSLTWSGNIWLKLIIKFSYHFSEFGQSVSKPLVALLVGNFILFSVLLIAGMFYPLHFSITNRNWTGFWQGFYEYFWIINPLRKADDTFKNGFILLDILNRIWSSYMLYNIIRASRRFIK